MFWEYNYAVSLTLRYPHAPSGRTRDARTAFTTLALQGREQISKIRKKKEERRENKEGVKNKRKKKK